ncbi:GlxA family transcriptional regulator [Parasphingorhabdus litoris]|uniref:GlxA family transcriptional regulator n=1 Tax=Parasphingorhabdus litoris TaxID=394733 RepID=A0ABN1AL62_9SPHN|nr:DJ-1/PfpI family protein [Parasphingorhabdus litoris]
MSISAKTERILFVGFEGLQMLDLVGPADVFSIASMRAHGRYAVHYVGTRASVRASNGLVFQLEKLPKVRSSDTIIIPGGMARSVFNAMADQALLNWLTDAAAQVHRVASICSGAFVLARLGLLENKRAVTHWSAADRLAKTAPNIKIEKDAIFVEDGKIWTSAGVTTGIDLALAMVRRDIDETTALQIARDIVVHVIRPGNQSQYSAPLMLQKNAGPNLDRLIPWLESRLSETTSVADMAMEVGLSERQFHRQCLLQFGRTPAKLALELKLDHARNFLQEDQIPIATISKICGFSDSAAFSKAFKKQFAISPAMFRNHWKSDGVT